MHWELHLDHFLPINWPLFSDPQHQASWFFFLSACGGGRWVESLSYSSATQAQPEMTSERHASFWVTDKSLDLFHNKMTSSYSNNTVIFILGDSWSLNSMHALMLKTFSIKDFTISFRNYCMMLYMTGTFNLCSKKKMLPKNFFLKVKTNSPYPFWDSVAIERERKSGWYLMSF